MKRGNQYDIKVSINGVELWRTELLSLMINLKLGNVMPTCTISVATRRRDVHLNMIHEMSKVKIHIKELGKHDVLIEERRFNFFIASIDNCKLDDTDYDRYLITVTCIADAPKYLSEAKVKGAKDRATNIPKFMETMECFGNEEGKMRLVIKDGLLSRATDWKHWIQHDITGAETVNYLLQRAIVETKTNKVDGNNREYPYSANITFDKAGRPTLYLMDLKLRAQTFPPRVVNKAIKDGIKASVPLFFKYVLKDEKEGFVYTNLITELNGAGASSQFWGRTAMVYDTEENSFEARKVKQPKMFSDSQEYIDSLNGNAKNLSGFPIFKSLTRWNNEMYSTDHYNKNHPTQKMQVGSATFALNKVVQNMEFLGHLIDINPSDIVKIDVLRNAESGSEKTLHKDDKLSSKYMVTEVTYVFAGDVISTYVRAGRDTFV